MRILLIKYLLKAQANRPGDRKRTYEYIPYLKLMEVEQVIQRGLMTRFLNKYILKAEGSRPGSKEGL